MCEQELLTIGALIFVDLKPVFGTRKNMVSRNKLKFVHVLTVSEAIGAIQAPPHAVPAIAVANADDVEGAWKLSM